MRTVPRNIAATIACILLTLAASTSASFGAQRLAPAVAGSKAEPSPRQSSQGHPLELNRAGKSGDCFV